MHEALKDLALGAQPLSILVQICFGCNLLAFQALLLLLCNLDPVHLTLTCLIQSLKPATKAEALMHMYSLKQLMATDEYVA